MDSLGFEPRASAYFTSGFKVMKPFGCKGSALPAELRAPHRDIARYTQQSICISDIMKLQRGPNESYMTAPTLTIFRLRSIVLYFVRR